MSTDQLITLSDIEAALPLVREHLHRTPLLSAVLREIFRRF